MQSDNAYQFNDGVIAVSLINCLGFGGKVSGGGDVPAWAGT
ncbi:hypothetical protein [Leclercia pneumoniae]